MTMLLAVLGGDVSTSLSPLIHEAAAAATGHKVAYLPVSASDPEDFHEKVRALQRLGAVGANVTIPFKSQAYALATAKTPLAEDIGAVNTLVFRADGRIEGDNTDGPGMLVALSSRAPEQLEVVRILGAGGAARAVAWAARESGAARVQIAARRAEAAEDLAARFGGEAVALDGGLPPTLVISTLPKSASDVGWAGLDRSRQPAVVDLAYEPQGAPTPLVAAARAAGLEAEDGLGLLVEQGALAFAEWTEAPLAPVRSAMARAAAQARTTTTAG